MFVIKCFFITNIINNKIKIYFSEKNIFLFFGNLGALVSRASTWSLPKNIINFKIKFIILFIIIVIKIFYNNYYKREFFFERIEKIKNYLFDFQRSTCCLAQSYMSDQKIKHNSQQSK
jgi:hypothetical protein